MAFTSVPLSDSIFHLQSGANSGLLRAGNQAIVIDCGLDDDAGKKIKKTLESMNLTLAALLITHGHGDHFGGAAYLRRSLPPFVVYAPATEAAFIENPNIEGIFLSGGALPFDAFKGKFTLAQPCKVDHLLEPGTLELSGLELEVMGIAGHSPSQVAVRCGDVLFSADAFLPVETLQKYPIPFTVHIGSALDALDRLAALEGVTFAPGHGVHLMDARPVIEANRAALLRVVAAVEDALATGPLDDSAATQAAAVALGDALATPVGYALARTTVQAALVYLYEQKRALWEGGAGRFGWRRI